MKSPKGNLLGQFQLISVQEKQRLNKFSHLVLGKHLKIGIYTIKCKEIDNKLKVGIYNLIALILI
jgi:hypothetical protein